MNNKGFISIVTVLVLIVAVSALLLANLDSLITKNNLLKEFKEDARETINSSYAPTCLWSPSQVVTFKQNETTIFNVSVSCTHIDNLVFNNGLEPSSINNLNVRDIFNIDESLKVYNVSVYEITNGYEIKLTFQLDYLVDKINGKNYNISLKENVLCANDNCNNFNRSNNIKIEAE